MQRYLLRRAVQAIPTLLLVTLVTFSITMLLPGDPALAFLGEAQAMDKVAYNAMRQELGLDQPIPVQYVALAQPRRSRATSGRRSGRASRWWRRCATASRSPSS